MAQINDIIENPVVGDRVQFLVTSADSKGKLLKVSVWIKEGAQGPPEHTHPVQIETFEIIAGTAGLKVNGINHFLGAGEKMTVPNNTPHKFWNAGNEELTMIGTLEPALRTEYFLESMYSLASKGKVKKNAVPKNIFQFAAILKDCYGEFFLVGPPIFAQKFLAKVVGKAGNILGYKGFVPFDR